ncbi:MAG: UvrD-helicase domain-containing protein [Prevotellaceae bacterium]|nr:UvrD-helicase domain-containing protein [Prevotellaceae bacterium]
MQDKRDFLSELNPSQRAAVEYCDGPSLVIAGAGSGKTRVLTYKIAYLLAQGYAPWSILALTFTNKAADEMKQRVQTLLNDDDCVRHLWMGTFHSVFLHILRIEHEHIGFPSNFTIYDAGDSKSLLKAILKELQLDDKQYKLSTVQAHISNAKNQLVTAEEYVANPQNLQTDTRQKMPQLGTIYMRYARRCRQAAALDFDDILLYIYLLFEQHPDVLAKYAERFRYVLVDEYQDTNYAQHRIVWQLTRDRQRVCVVGDDAQSIYAFRGADIDNILSFNRTYTDSKLFKLEQNYRSTQTIVEAANSLIHKNRGQIYKNVFSEKERGERIRVSEAYSDLEEAQIVVRKIQQLHRKESLDYSAFAILYRTNAQSRVLEEELRKNGCPYKVYGGLSFYQRKEIKDVIAYFRLSVNPNDEEAFRRVLNYPTRGIGATTQQRIIDCATTHEVGIWNVVSQPHQYGLDATISKAALGRVEQFRLLIDGFRQRALSENAEAVGHDIVQQSGVWADIYQNNQPENRSKQENVEELLNGMQEFCRSRLEEGNEAVSLTDYLSEVSLLSDVDGSDDDAEHRVTLMTIHSAKGLEFHCVFIVGLEENLFPSQLASGSQREMEEERRLFYVALTRAERHCFLSYAKSRMRYGQMEFGSRSRFVDDIDAQYLDFEPSGRSSRRAVSDDVELPWKSSMRRTMSPMPSTTPSVRTQPPAGFRRVAQPAPSSPVVSSASTPASPRPAVTSGLQAGQHIEHERFGFGVVEKVEGSGDGMKATVRFQHAGTKQLLLKFARFKIVD